MKIFPEMAKAMAFCIANDHMTNMLMKTLDQIEAENFDMLDIMHHYTAIFKSIQTQDSYEALDKLR